MYFQFPSDQELIQALLMIINISNLLMFKRTFSALGFSALSHCPHATAFWAECFHPFTAEFL